MSIDDMTALSHFLFAAAGIFAVFAVVLFFVFNIPKCCRMVSGKIPARGSKPRGTNKKTEKTCRTDSLQTEMPSRSGETLPLDLTSRETLLLDGDLGETLLLDGASQETLLLDGNLDIVQNIAYYK